MQPPPITAGATRQEARIAIGRTGVRVPPVLFGVSALGNLYRVLPRATKRAIVDAARATTIGPVCFDAAGKYGAGMALEELGAALRASGAQPDEVVISNKLGWRRAPLLGTEPTFEPGAWIGLNHDAVQDISHDGILRCWEEGSALIAAPYRARLLSVHDPDEYLAGAQDERSRCDRFADILGAYRALDELRASGKADAIGIGAKDWRVAREVAERVNLDWIMLACCLTVKHHPPELLSWLRELAQAGVTVIDSALFHGGFLTGGDHYDYRRVDPKTEEGRRLCAWRASFHDVCQRHGIEPATACVRFALLVPGVACVALNTTDPARVPANVAMATAEIPCAFWGHLADAGLIDRTLEFVP